MWIAVMSMLAQPCVAPQRVDCFSVFSTPDPSALPRIFEVFSLHGLIPTRCHSACVDRDDDQLVIDIQVSELPHGLANQLTRRLRRVITVTEVLWSQKRPAAA
jgi:hypothetical protein